MITTTIRTEPGQKDTIIEKPLDIIESTRLEPCCINFRLYANTENKDVLLMIEHWKNPEVLDAPMQPEHFKVFDKAIEDILAEELDFDISLLGKKIF
jgi:quinol monooxygenase YgiN